MSAASIEIGSAAIPEASSPIPVTPADEIERSLQELAAQRESWIDLGIPERIRLLEQMRKDMLAVAPAWVEAACAAKRITRGTPTEGEEWLAGPFTVIRNLRLFQRSLEQLLRYGKTLPPGDPVTRPGDVVAVPVFPSEVWDKIFFSGMTAEVWMDPSVTLKNVQDHTGMIYRQKANGEREEGKIALVLGAGNVASIGPMDALYKLFCEDQVVVLKTNPVNAYLAPFIEKGFRAVIEPGFLRIVVGGADEGRLLCEHELVEEIHITGSDKTHDTIVFGGGEEGARRKEAGERLNQRRITSELGNVSPVIVVPGPWSPKDFAFQGMNLASMLTNNGGFNCNATRVIITSDGWSGREPLLNEVRKTLNGAPTRYAYYPGAQDRMDAFVAAHPEAEPLGQPADGHLPWTLIPGVDAEDTDDICFNTEAFCSVFAETSLKGDTTPQFIDKAVDFCNDKVWGTLNAALLVHPESLKDPEVNAAVERAVANLRYGAVCINHWPAVVYGVVTTTWGGHPGQDVFDVKSGIGVVHNSFFFERPMKSVFRGPFRMPLVPPWFVTHKNIHNVGKRLTSFEADPSLARLPGIALAAVKA